MIIAVQTAPPHGLICLSGGSDFIPPLPIWGALTLATNSCITTRCMPEVDGPTEIVLGDVAEVDPGRPADFVSLLRVPDGEVVVSTVEDEILLTMPSPNKLFVAKIWRSHPLWPENVTIGIEAPIDLVAAQSMMLPIEQATRTVMLLPDDAVSLLLCDSGVPRLRGNFNPWTSPAFMASAAHIPVEPHSELEVITTTPKRFLGRPDLDTVVSTPSKEIRIFPSGQTVLLMIDTETARTRVRVWIERQSEHRRVLMVLSEADDPSSSLSD